MCHHVSCSCSCIGVGPIRLILAFYYILDDGQWVEFPSLSRWSRIIQWFHFWVWITDRKCLSTGFVSEFLIQQVSMMASAENILETCLTLLSLISAEGLLASHDDVSRESHRSNLCTVCLSFTEAKPNLYIYSVFTLPFLSFCVFSRVIVLCPCCRCFCNPSSRGGLFLHISSSLTPCSCFVFLFFSWRTVFSWDVGWIG